jgi:hypothetical protein
MISCRACNSSSSTSMQQQQQQHSHHQTQPGRLSAPVAEPISRLLLLYYRLESWLSGVCC